MIFVGIAYAADLLRALWVFQREFMWQRHSSIHNFLNPTWPTEWRQFMPLMAFADYITPVEERQLGVCFVQGRSGFALCFLWRKVPDHHCTGSLLQVV